MGNSSSSYGDILIQLDQPFYYVGEIVSGNIYINLVKPNYPGNKIFITIVGIEQCIWWEHKNTTVKANRNKKRYVHHTNRNEANRVILNNSILVHQFNSQVINEGQHQIPFKFQAPTGIPGTYFYDKWGYDAKIKYTLKAHVPKLDFKDTSDIIQNSIELNLRQLVNPENEESRLQEDSSLVFNCCCCCPKGECIVYGSLNKSLFEAGETAKVYIQIDNTRCRSNIKIIEAIFRMTVTLISSTDKQILFTFPINKDQAPGIKRGERITQSNQLIMEIKLKNIINPNQELPPSVNGVYIQTSYEIHISCKMDICCKCCCQKSPFVDLPITLNTEVQVQDKYRAPDDWNPEVYEEQMLAVDIKQNKYFLFQNDLQIKMSIYQSFLICLLNGKQQINNYLILDIHISQIIFLQYETTHSFCRSRS